MSRSLPALFLLAFAIIFSTPAQADTVRIMPMGDSITVGATVPGFGGYRGPLYTLLTNAGHTVDYVGTVTTNSASVPDMDHEGHGGWKIDQLDSNVEAWFDAIDDPDIILLHIGTNDFGLNFDTPNAINRLDALLTKIATLRPNIHVIVTNLLERDEPENAAIQTEFNPFVEGVVNAQVAAGHKASFLDMRALVPYADLTDGLHPNAIGYSKMADAWFPAIEAVTGPVPPPPAPGLFDGDVLVQWGDPAGDPEIVSAQVNGAILTTTWSTATPVTPVVDVDYYPSNSNRSPAFYGASSTGARAQFFSNAAGDFINTTSGVSPGSHVEGMVMWRAGGDLSGDFGFPTTGYTLADLSILVSARQPDASGTLRWIIEKSGQHYISTASYAFAGNAFTQIIADAGSLSWNTFTPFAGGSAVIGSAASPTLDGVDSVGYFFDSVNGNATTAKHVGAQVRSFLVDVIPTLTSRGTPHTWLNSFGLVTGGDYEAADLLDSDGDGQLNWQEYQAGTDPSAAASVFKMTGTEIVGGQLIFHWNALSGKTYRIEYKADLPDAEWTILAGGVPGVEPESTGSLTMGAATTGFIRVSVE